MPRTQALLALIALTGCRQVLGIEDPPEGPAASSSAAGGGTSSTTSADTGSASTAGGGGTGGDADPSTSTTSAGGAGGSDCQACGEVACCLSACLNGVCSATSWDLGGAGQRIVDAGDRVAVVVVPDDGIADLRWVPVDHAQPALPAACVGIPGDDGLGYLAAHEGAAFYALHADLDDPGGGGNGILRIAPSCANEYFVSSVASAGLLTRGDALLSVSRKTSSVACRTFDGRPCPGVADDVAIEDGFAVALDGNLVLWTAIGVGGGALLLGDGPPQALVDGAAPVDLVVPSADVRWALTVAGGTAQVVAAPATVLCGFPAEGALGLDVDGDHVLLPHAEGLLACDTTLEGCRLDPRGPVHDVVVTPTAVFFTAGTDLVRVQRPLEGYLATLEERDACP